MILIIYSYANFNIYKHGTSHSFKLRVWRETLSPDAFVFNEFRDDNIRRTNKSPSIHNIRRITRRSIRRRFVHGESGENNKE